MRFILLPGPRFDTVGVPPLIDGVTFGALIADKAFDSNAILPGLNERGAKDRHLPNVRAGPSPFLSTPRYTNGVI